MILRYFHHLTGITFIIPAVLAETTKPNTGDQVQGFTFAYPSSPNSNSVTIPLTPSCPSPLIISGLTTTNNPLSADPVAPYTMIFLVHEQLVDGAGLRYERMYARSMDIGNMAAQRSVNNVWANGTQFISCVWASNGVSGGCQDLMTVSTSALTATAYADATSECRQPSVMGSWVTPQSSTLDVTVEHSAGILASNGWPATCSDLRITPRNGTAPYTLLIAPAFHPPVNITSATRGSMNYTIRLTHGQAFMLGVFDSAGNSFAFGPLHAGRADDVRCLAVTTGQEMPAGGSGGVPIGALAGSVVAALLLGATGAALIIWGCFLRKRKGQEGRSQHDLLFDEAMSIRPFSQRNDSDQSYSNPKPLDPYEDSPHRGGGAFDTPDTLYDPYVGGSGSSSSPSKLSRPPGASFSVTSRNDFGPPVHRIQSRDDPNMAIHTPSNRSRQSDPKHPSSSGSTQHRPSPSFGMDGKMPPPALRLVGTPIQGSSNTHPWDETSDGEDVRRDAGKSGQGPRSNRPTSSRLGSHEEHEGRPRKVYVVHSDGGAGDVHIQLPEGGARVIEMPPNYRDEPSTQSGLGLGLQTRTGGTLSPISTSRQPAHFGPRAPRPASITSQTSIPARDSSVIAGVGNEGLYPQPAGRPVVIRTKSGLERAEAAYLDLDLSDTADHRHPLSPPQSINFHSSPPLGTGHGGNRSSTGSVMGAEEIRARAEAALAEKSARG